MAATLSLFVLASIHASGPGGGEKPSGFAQDKTGSRLTSQAEQFPPKRQTPQKPDNKPNVSSLYRKHCQKCHDQDGTGSEGRDTYPEIPDFTSEKWQKGRNNARLVASILDGKGTSMPPFADKLSNEKVKALAAFVRSFDLPKSKAMAATDKDFDKQFRQLSEQMKELRKQFRDLSKRPDEP